MSPVIRSKEPLLPDAKIRIKLDGFQKLLSFIRWILSN